MSKSISILILICFLCSCKNTNQELEWGKPPYPFLEGKVSALDNNIRYTMDSTLTIAERAATINKIQRYIDECLSLINESVLEDSVHIVLAKDRKEIAKYIYKEYVGAYMPKDFVVPENMLFSIYGTDYDPLKHEIMHLVSISKWGEETDTTRACWLEEGLAAWAGQEAENCDGHSIEERYAYLLQNDLLFGFDTLCTPNNNPLDHKIYYTQTAYIVSYLLENYGTDKLKKLWQSDANSFEKIYGSSLISLSDKMNDIVKQKYNSPIEFNWEAFQKPCID